jgi:hypothetical protein
LLGSMRTYRVDASTAIPFSSRVRFLENDRPPPRFVLYLPGLRVIGPGQSESGAGVAKP